MEHDLETHLHSHDMDTQEQLLLFSHVIQGLAFMHMHGMVHRDLKPSNILLGLHRNGRVSVAKIGDFGSSKQDRSNHMRSYVGTSVYMAPEFWENPPSYSKAVDLWSFGIISLQCLTGWDVHGAGWDRMTWLTKDERLDWMKEIKKRELPAAPEIFRPMLEGLLATSASARWSAVQTGTWLSQCTARQTYKDDALSKGTPNPTDICHPSTFDTISTVAEDPFQELFSTATSSIHLFSPTQLVSSGTGGIIVAKARAQDDAVRSAEGDRNLSVLDHELRLDVDGQTVTLRKNDCHFDASEILAIASLTYNERKNILERVKRKTGQVCSDARWARVWITYGHSLLLSDFVEVKSSLQPLFDFAAEHLGPLCAAPDDDLSAYLDRYMVVQTGSANVSVRMRDHRVNVTQVLKAHGYSQKQRYDEIAAACETAEHVAKVPKRHVGFYCTLQEALGLCERLGLETVRISLEGAIAVKTSGEHMALEGAFGHQKSAEHDERAGGPLYSILTEQDCGDFLPQMPDLI